MPQTAPLVARQDAAALQEFLAYRAAISLGSWIDMQASGTLTSTAFNSSGGMTPETATLWIRNHDAYRLDVQKPKGISSLRIDGTYGALQHQDGHVRAMDARDAVAGLFAFPMLMEATLPATNTMLVDQGTVIVDGAALHRISVESPWPGNPLDDKGKPLTTVTDLYFNPQTHLLAKSANAMVGSKATPERYRSVVTYADYRAVNGMQIPFLYRETLNGQILWTLQLNQIQLNQGVSQTEFHF